MNIIDIIFNVVNSIVMLLALFSVVASMRANIADNVKEISILRAVGGSNRYLRIAYLLEAFVLIFSSCLIGVIVGTIVAWTMSM